MRLSGVRPGDIVEVDGATDYPLHLLVREREARRVAGYVLGRGERRRPLTAPAQRVTGHWRRARS